MDKKEAALILSEQLSKYRELPYEQLAARIDTIEVVEISAPSGVVYTLEFQFVWDSKPDGDIRVLGAIDDGGFRAAFSPMCDDFILAPDGTFVDE